MDGEPRPSAPVSEIGRRAAFGFSALDEIGQFLGDGGVHWRRFVFLEDAFPGPVGALGRLPRAIGRPGLVIAPSRKERRVIGGGVAVLRVLGAKEMTR